MKNLALGLYEDNSLKEETISEILNHHGILFEKCNEDNINNYPVLITSEKTILEHNNKVIFINDELINRFNEAFSGAINLEEEERISARISFFEQEVLTKITNAYKELKLPFVRKWYWPDFKKICILLIHDIDNIDVFPGTKSKKEFMKYSFYRFLDRPRGHME